MYIAFEIIRWVLITSFFSLAMVSLYFSKIKNPSVSNLTRAYRIQILCVVMAVVLMVMYAYSPFDNYRWGSVLWSFIAGIMVATAWGNRYRRNKHGEQVVKDAEKLLSRGDYPPHSNIPSYYKR